LTARLSIWMSLWGLRPMSVRSLPSVCSFRTCPSTLRISLAIVVSSVLPEECLQAGQPPAGHVEVLGNPDEHRGDVVAAAVVVRGLDQLLDGERRVGLERHERHADLLVLD